MHPLVTIWLQSCEEWGGGRAVPPQHPQQVGSAAALPFPRRFAALEMEGAARPPRERTTQERHQTSDSAPHKSGGTGGSGAPPRERERAGRRSDRHPRQRPPRERSRAAAARPSPQTGSRQPRGDRSAADASTARRADIEQPAQPRKWLRGCGLVMLCITITRYTMYNTVRHLQYLLRAGLQGRSTSRLVVTRRGLRRADQLRYARRRAPRSAPPYLPRCLSYAQYIALSC